MTAAAAVVTADADLTDANNQISLRSWVYSVLGQSTPGEWTKGSSGCETSSNPKCTYNEDTTVVDADPNRSEWTWPA